MTSMTHAATIVLVIFFVYAAAALSFLGWYVNKKK